MYDGSSLNPSKGAPIGTATMTAVTVGTGDPRRMTHGIATTTDETVAPAPPHSNGGYAMPSIRGVLADTDTGPQHEAPHGDGHDSTPVPIYTYAIPGKPAKGTRSRSPNYSKDGREPSRDSYDRARYNKGGKWLPRNDRREKGSTPKGSKSPKGRSPKGDDRTKGADRFRGDDRTKGDSRKASPKGEDRYKGWSKDDARNKAPPQTWKGSPTSKANKGKRTAEDRKGQSPNKQACWANHRGLCTLGAGCPREHRKLTDEEMDKMKAYEQTMRQKGRKPHGRPPFFRPDGKGKQQGTRKFAPDGTTKIKGKGKGRQAKASKGKGGDRGKGAWTLHTKACPVMCAGRECETAGQGCVYSHEAWRVPRLQKAIARFEQCYVGHWPDKWDKVKHPKVTLTQHQGLALPGLIKQEPPFAGWAEDVDYDENYDSECNWSDTQSAFEQQVDESASTHEPEVEEAEASSYEDILSDDSMFAGNDWHA